MFRIIFISILLTLNAYSELPLIPRPATVKEKGGALTLDSPCRVRMDDFRGGAVALQNLSDALGGQAVKVRDGERPQIVIQRNPSAPKGEGYTLEVTEKGVIIRAADDAGLFYGAGSLVQLISGQATRGKIPLVAIEDSPRFAWRGYMLDESRHFSGEAAAYRLLDAMARYKLNRFHWHLTDSTGWRIEIKKYPKLTGVGSRGNQSDGPDKAPPQFYTQDQIRKIVAYAKDRHITVIPEIDMPGHADAAVRSYPELSGGVVRKGNPNKRPHFTFNPAKPEVFTFLEDVLKEVRGLFPDAEMIHFGGDEVHFGWANWLELPEVQALMKSENLKDNREVETWFLRRMSKFIQTLGVETGGWDEIVGRSLIPEKTVVFWWRQDKGKVLEEALAAGHPVVLCPRRPCYLDFLQDGSHKSGRVMGGFNPIEDVYNFPASLKLSEKDEKQVRGIQGCLWTETAKSQERRDFMTWPRLVALAEAAWTKADRKDYESFALRFPREIEWLKAHGIHSWDPIAKTPEVSDSGKKVEYLD
jgi:hexosaminidase